MTYNEFISLASFVISVISVSISFAAFMLFQKVSKDNKSLKDMYFDLLARLKVAIKTKDENQ